MTSVVLKLGARIMCKLLELKGHPHKFVECSNKCYHANWASAGFTLYVFALGTTALWIYLLS